MGSIEYELSAIYQMRTDAINGIVSEYVGGGGGDCSLVLQQYLQA